jgi:UPF0755 protein
VIRRLAVGLLILVLGAVVALEVFGVGSGARVVRVTVAPNLRVRDLGATLARDGAIRSSLVFRVWATLTGHADDEVPSGRFLLTRPTPYAELVQEIRSGRRRVIQQVAQRLMDSLAIPIDSTLAAVRDSATRARVGTPAPDVEGYLFPATYEFLANGITSRGAVDSMLTTFERRWRPAWDSALKRDGRTRHEVVTLASIVEREAAKQAERPLIAAVYSNRLRDGQRLQADPTVLYGMGIVAKRVTYDDLKHDSPYNTYRNAGLPPGPIGAPGAASLAAAVSPAPVPYKFFVAFPDGHHEFRTTYDEHLQAVAAARAARADRSAVAP